MAGRLLGIIVGLGVFAATLAAHAEEPAPTDIERLKATAFRQFANGEWAEGIRNMEAAYRLAPRPEYLFNIAVAYQKWGGHCEETLRTFRLFFQVCGDCSAKAVASERSAAADEACLAEFVPKAAEVTLRATVPSATFRVGTELVVLGSPSTLRLVPGEHRVRVSAGGKTAEHVLRIRGLERLAIELAIDEPRPPPRLLVRHALTDEVRLDDDHFDHKTEATPVKRGLHTVRVLRGVHLISTTELFLDDGQTFELDLVPPGADVEPVEDAAKHALVAAPPAPSSSHAATWIGAGVALGGLVVGTVFTVETLGDLDRRDTANAATIPNEALVNEAQDASVRHAIFANVGFGVAIAGAAFAVISYLLEPDEPSASGPASAPARGPTGVVVHF